MGDSWSNPRAYAPTGAKTIEYSAPEPLRMEAICSSAAECASNEKYRYSHFGLRIASSVASDCDQRRTASISGNRAARVVTGTTESESGRTASTMERVDHDLDPEQDKTDGHADDDHRDRGDVCHLLERVLRDRCADQPNEEYDDGHDNPETLVLHIQQPRCATDPGREADGFRDFERPESARADSGLAPSSSLDTLIAVLAANYRSGDDFVVEFLGHRFEFSSDDFAERVTAAAVRLELVASNDLDAEEAGDLVELVADGRIADPRSGLGLYLVRHWEHVSLVKQESLVYWLRKLVFRGAWLDHRVKEGLLDVSWEDNTGDFGYAEPKGGRTLLELAPVPSWRELQYRG